MANLRGYEGMMEILDFLWLWCVKMVNRVWETQVGADQMIQYARIDVWKVSQVFKWCLTIYDLDGIFGDHE